MYGTIELAGTNGPAMLVVAGGGGICVGGGWEIAKQYQDKVQSLFKKVKYIYTYIYKILNVTVIYTYIYIN